MYAVVDIETTGGRLNRDRITEIAIFRFDGKKIVDQYQTLINPELPIPRNITRLTGIDDQMVANAPKFYEVAKQIVEMTDEAIFVAHNVNFDYNFLKAEFKRFGFTYQRKRLCTVRLARRVLPGHPSYSLGRICKDLKIKIKARHRAAGDAEATVQLLKKIILADEEGVVDTFQKYGSREAILPPHLEKSVVDDLPDSPGVYYFHDDQGKIMYVGKAVDIRARILSHFQPNLGSRKALRMKLQIHDISYQLTGNDLVAQLLESHEIKTLKPRFNVSQKRVRNVFGIFGHEDESGYLNLSIGRIKADGPKPLTSFGGSRAARGYMEALVRRYNLCQGKTGLYSTDGPCFNYQIHRCEGACAGDETPERYNKRVRAAIDKMNVYDRSFVLIEEGRTPYESAVIIVENGKYLGFGFIDQDMQIEDPVEFKQHIDSYDDNRDIQRILNRYLRSKNKGKLLELKAEALVEAD